MSKTAKGQIVTVAVIIAVVMLFLIPDTGLWLLAEAVAIVLGIVVYRWWTRHDVRHRPD